MRSLPSFTPHPPPTPGWGARPRPLRPPPSSLVARRAAARPMPSRRPPPPPPLPLPTGPPPSATAAAAGSGGSGGGGDGCSDDSGGGGGGAPETWARAFTVDPQRVLYKDERVVAFWDRSPAAAVYVPGGGGRGVPGWRRLVFSGWVASFSCVFFAPAPRLVAGGQVSLLVGGREGVEKRWSWAALLGLPTGISRRAADEALF